MESPAERIEPEPPTGSLLFNKWLWGVILVGQLSIPLFISLQGKEIFRLPKEVALRTQAILLIGLALAGAARGVYAPRLDFRSPSVFLPLAIVGWTAIATLLSTNRTLSTYALSTVVLTALTFIIMSSLAASHSLGSLTWLLIPAALTSVFGALQFWNVWRPFQLPDNTGKIAITALLGGSTDVAVFLLMPSLVAISLAIAANGTKRIVYTILFLLLSVGIVICQNRTVLLAFVTGLVALSLIASPRKALAGLLAAICLTALVLFTSKPVRSRLNDGLHRFENREYNAVLSLRLTAFMAAWSMFKERPIAGMGPDTFHWHYFPYNLALTERYPELLRNDWPENFAEVHNDHLQILAEAGVGGYLLFVTVIIWFAQPSLSRALPAHGFDRSGQRRRFLRLFSLPFAASFFVLALAQFPLRLSATVNSLLFLAALRAAWWRSGD